MTTICKDCNLDETGHLYLRDHTPDCIHWGACRDCESCGRYRWSVGNMPEWHDGMPAHEDCAECAGIKLPSSFRVRWVYRYDRPTWFATRGRTVLVENLVMFNFGFKGKASSWRTT